MTLTELNYYVRKFMPIGVIFFLVILVLFLAVQLIILYLNSQPNQQTQELPPAVIEPTFNNIKPPIIPQAKSSGNYTYILDTLDGTSNVENATNSATIYFLPKPTATFGFLSQIYLMAQAVGINTEVTPHKLSDNRAIFDDGKNKLQIDINNFNFNYDFVLTKEDSNFTADRKPTKSELESQASGFFNKISRYPQELAQGKKNIIYFSYNPENNQVTPLESEEGANMAEIDFYRPDVNGYPVVTSTYYNSPHYVLFGFAQAGLKVVRSQVSLLEKSEDQTGIYPLKSSSEAWEELAAGKGSVVSSSQDNGEIKIKKVFLAYYDPDVYQEYFQPVYVFLGDNRFVAYVTAVTNQYMITTGE